jgi:hypothetical protein
MAREIIWPSWSQLTFCSSQFRPTSRDTEGENSWQKLMGFAQSFCNRGPMWLRKGYKGLQDPDCKEWPEFWEAVKPFWCIDTRWPAWQASSRLFSPSLSEYDGIHMSKWLGPGKLLFPILVLLIHDIWSFATNTQLYVITYYYSRYVI